MLAFLRALFTPSLSSDCPRDVLIHFLSHLPSSLFIVIRSVGKMKLPKIYNTYFVAIIATMGGMLYVSRCHWKDQKKVSGTDVSQVRFRYLIHECHNRDQPVHRLLQ